MLEKIKKNHPRYLLATAVIAVIVIFNAWLPVIASDDHDEARYLKNQGEIIELSELINKAGLQDMRVLEAELEREHGKMVYEIEFLDTDGRVYEQYFDAITGEPMSEPRRD